MRREMKVLGLCIAMVLTPYVSVMAKTKIYEGSGFICKAFKIDEKSPVGTVTGSVLYQKKAAINKDVITFQGITTNCLTSEFLLYAAKGKDANEAKKKLKSITLPDYEDNLYRFNTTIKVDTKWTKGKMVIDSAYSDKIVLIAKQ